MAGQAIPLYLSAHTHQGTCTLEDSRRRLGRRQAPLPPSLEPPCNSCLLHSFHTLTLASSLLPGPATAPRVGALSLQAKDGFEITEGTPFDLNPVVLAISVLGWSIPGLLPSQIPLYGAPSPLPFKTTITLLFAVQLVSAAWNAHGFLGRAWGGGGREVAGSNGWSLEWIRRRGRGEAAVG